MKAKEKTMKNKRFKDAQHALAFFRTKYPSTSLSFVLYWRSIKKKNTYHWTKFARNGRITAASTEGFCSSANAKHNYELSIEGTPQFYII